MLFGHEIGYDMTGINNLLMGVSPSKTVIQLMKPRNMDVLYTNRKICDLFFFRGETKFTDF